uniref:Uncharacterized protein n=1 Tax=Arundo donax TaxID=35708 RepID=A0A0A8YCK1_ARUDO
MQPDLVLFTGMLLLLFLCFIKHSVNL